MTLRKPGPGRVFLSYGRRGALFPGRELWALGRALLLLACCAVAQWAAPDGAAAATAAQQGTQRAQAGALHGQSWAFGHSEDRKEAIWRRGVPAQSLKQRAVGGAAPAGKARIQKGSAQTGASVTGSAAKSAPGKTAPAQSRGATPPQGVVDTESGIDRALAAAQAMADAEAAEAAKDGQTKPKGSLGLSMKDTTTTWNVTPMREAMRPDEKLVRDKHHVVRAFAGVEPTDDLSISVGPELILKDEQHGAESAGSSQPDSALGLGMQFKLDF